MIPPVAASEAGVAQSESAALRQSCGVKNAAFS